MLKNVVVATLVAGILGAGSIATAVDLQELIKGKEKVTRNGVDFWIESNSPIKKEVLNGEFDNVAQKLISETDKEKSQARMSPANPLNKVHISEVTSSQGGTEKIAYRQGATKNDHGGSVFKVKTVISGFGCIADTAQFNKRFVKRIDSILIVPSGSNIAAGCIDTRDLSGQFQNGNFIFTAKNSSGNVNYPKQIVESLLIK